MKIFIDKDCRCHISNDDGTYTEIDAPELFIGKCPAYIEGCRFVPSGSTWTRQDGVVFHGEMISPWKDWRELDAAQRAYERQQLADYEHAMSEIEAALGVTT